MRALLLTLSLSAAFGARAAHWFVDKTALGLNNGTSLVNAWTSTTNIVWGASGVTAGDTLWIAGNATAYADGVSVGASGTAGNPITIRNAAENGGPNLPAEFPAISLGARTNIVLDGRLSSSFVPPTSVWNIADIKPNLGFRTRRDNGVGIFMNGAGGVNNTIRWVEVGNHGTLDDIGTVHGIQLLNITSLQNFLIEYCWVHNIQNDGINHNSTANRPNYFDALRVQWCLIEETGDDGIQYSSSGLTVANCWLKSHWNPLYNGHPDQLQLAGVSQGYYKIVNNVMNDKGNSLVISEFLAEEGGTLGPLYVLGNIFYTTRDWALLTAQVYGATFNAWRPNADISVAYTSWTNLWFLNNTFYYQRTIPFQVGRANPSGSTRSVWNLEILNGGIKNNLFVDCRYNTGSPGPLLTAGDGDPGTGTNGVYFLHTNWPLTHNTVAGPNKGASYDGAIHSDIATFGNSNTSGMPSLVDTNNYDLRLNSSDTVARGTGDASVATLTNTVPEFMRDAWGNERFVSGIADRGAHSVTGEQVEDNLLLHIDFSEASGQTTGVYSDKSGYNAHGLHFGYGNDQVNSNRFPAQITWTNQFTGLTKKAGVFQRFNDDWDEYQQSATYVAITNHGHINNINRATVMAWARYGAHDPVGYVVYANRRFLSGGYAYPGSWTMGLYGNRFTQLRLYTNSGAASDIYVSFTTSQEINNTNGDGTNMNHYAFTWDHGVVVTYKNAAPFWTNNQCALAGVTNLTIRGPAGGIGIGFLGIGTDTHNGAPWLIVPAGGVGDDGSGVTYENSGGSQNQYPNHAGFIGWIGDVRMYGSILTSNQIYAVMTSGVSGGGGPSAPAAPSGLAATATGQHSISLSWTDNSTTEDAFNIYRSTTSGSGFTLIDTVAANTTVYSDAGTSVIDPTILSPATTYYYRVTAINGAGESANSNQASATTFAAVTGATGNRLPIFFLFGP